MNHSVVTLGMRCQRAFEAHPDRAAELLKAYEAEGRRRRAEAIEAGDLDATRAVGIGLVTVDLAYHRAMKARVAS